MRVASLNLANFRGFESLEIAFDRRVTVIAGVNGLGKTGILQAIAHALSCALPKLTPSLEKPLAFADEDVKNGRGALDAATVLLLEGAQIHINAHRQLPHPEDMMAELVNNQEKLELQYRKRGLTALQKASIRKAIADIERELASTGERTLVRVLPGDASVSPEQFADAAKQRRMQPIAVFYGTTRRLANLPPILPKAKGMSIAAAYSNALTMDEVSQSDFANWLRALDEGGIARPDLASKILAQLEQAVSIFLPGLQGLLLQAGTPPRLSVQKDGERFFLTQLSDGEKGLLALVFDLVRRLAIANPESANPVAEGAAIVLIDEIELHLHPKWQRGVLANLKSVFKSCQFIVTTHSPLVLGEVPARCVRYLELDDDRVSCIAPESALGLDVNGILQKLMDAPVRNQRYEKLLHHLFVMVDEENFGRANRRIARLQKILGEHDPDLIRAQALIHFLRDDE